jgi:hypothetical protein
MSNTIADFPPDRFEIRAYCECGHDAVLPVETLPADLTVDALRSRLCCQACGRRDVQLSIIWTAAGGYAHSA